VSAADPFGLVGQVLDGQFRVDQLVGEGGFSVVYRGHHQGLNEPIAIKCLKLPTALGTSLVDTFVRRFRDESRILYRLSQGNLHVVRSIAAGTTQAPATGALVPYMVLEWLEGRSLQSDFAVRRTTGQSGRPLADVLKLFESAADGLAHAHLQGVVHRDLNPGNLFLATTPQGVKMKVLDFGVAKLMHDGALDMGPRAQTIGAIRIFAPAYGSPEQFDDRIGEVGAWSDVYSFALVVLEALRDRSVNEGTHLGEFAQAAVDPAKRPTPRALGLDVSDAVEAAFARATTLDPRERWQSAGDFWQSLVAAARPAAGPPAPAAKNGPLARTMPLGTNMGSLPRPAPAAGRPAASRTPTTLGIPAQGTGAPRMAPSSPDLGTASTTPASERKLPGAAPTTERFAPTASAKAPPSAPRAPTTEPAPAADGLGDSDLPPRNSSSLPTAADRKAPEIPAHLAPPPPPAIEDDGEEDEATRVHAPAPEMLRTLAFHDAANARAAALAKVQAAQAAQAAAAEAPRDETHALDVGAQRGVVPTPPKPPSSDRAHDASGDEDTGEGPESGGTLMMAPQAGMSPVQHLLQQQQQQQQGAYGPPPVAPGAPMPGPPPPHAARGGLGSTLAMAPPPHGFPGGQSAVYSQPGGGVAGPASTSPMQPPAGGGDMRPSQVVGGLAMPNAPQPQQGEGSSMTTFAPLVPLPPNQGGAVAPPLGSPPHAQQQQHAPPHAPYGQGGPGAYGQAPYQDQGGGFPPPPSFAQPQAGTAKPLPFVPIAIGLGILAVVGLGFGLYALGAKKPAPGHDVASASASAADSAATAVPVPVPVPSPAETAPPVPTVMTADDVDASAAAATTEDAGAADAATTAAATTATTAAAPTTTMTTTAPAFTAMPTPVPATATPKPAADPNAWNESAARSRLGIANGVLVICKKEGGVTGPGNASVTFSPDGTVASVSLDPPYAGTKEGDCVAAQLRRAKVNPYNGGAQTVRHAFEVPK